MNNNEVVTVEFLRDALSWLGMLLTPGAPCTIHGLELQQAMDEKYPAEWMAILYKIGQFDEPEPESDARFYWAGYNAFCSGRSLHNNPYELKTHQGREWDEGWQAGAEEAEDG